MKTEQKILEECRKPGHRDQGRVGQRTRDCHLVDCSWQKALTLCLTMRGSDQCQQGQCFEHPWTPSTWSIPNTEDTPCLQMDPSPLLCFLSLTFPPPCFFETAQADLKLTKPALNSCLYLLNAGNMDTYDYTQAF